MVAIHSYHSISSKRSLLIVALLFLTLMPSAPAASARSSSHAQADASSEALGDITSLTYHEITHWETGVNTRGEESPIISDDGNLIAFSRSPGSGDPANPNKIFVINVDGSGEREIDSYTPFCYCGSLIDISGDGTRIVVSDAHQIRIAASTGGAGQQLLALDSGEIDAVRISGDGGTIIFRVYRDTVFRESKETIERGIYAINPDGSNLRKLVGPDEMMPLLGVTRENVPFFAGGVIDLSHDGNEITFGMFIEPISGGAGQGLFALDVSSGAILKLIDRVAFILNAAISNDGSTVAYTKSEFDNPVESAGVMQFDGSSDHLLTNNTGDSPGIGMGMSNGSGERMQLTEDGARLILGSTGLLFDTATGQRLALSTHTHAFYSIDPTPLATDITPLITMNREGTTFVYLAADDRNVSQLTMLYLNPTELGAAPTITDPTVDPISIGLNGSSLATVKATVNTDNEYLRVGAVVLLNGLSDSHVSGSHYGPLVDDGLTNGDTTADDDIFTNDKVGTDCCAAPGPRIIRIQAETRTADGYRHATAVDITPFAVEGDIAATTVATTTATDATATTETGTATETAVIAETATPTTGASSGTGGDWARWTGEPDPADCTIAPITADAVVAALTDAAANPPTMLVEDPETIDDIPSGTPVDSATADDVLQSIWESNACINAGDFGRVLALFTPLGLQRLITSGLEAMQDPSAQATTPSAEELQQLSALITSALSAPPTPLDAGERSNIDEIVLVQGAPEDRVLVVTSGDSLVSSGQAVILLEKVGDRWLIAEIHAIGLDPQIASPLG